MDFKGKVVLITGAYGGIGEGLVRAFLKNDYEVVATGRRAGTIVSSSSKSSFFLI